ncbi:MAG: FtsX-like permease family protein [Thiothrix sp.]|nr:MAG: FtsX-like permease family protein [Thiothrix sp.]
MGILISSSLLATREIFRQPLRSALTVLGIIIGVVAVITMVTLGKGSTQNITNEIKSLGLNTLEIYGTTGVLTPTDLDLIREKIRRIKLISPESSANAKVIAGRFNTKTNILGITTAFFPVSSFAVSSGRTFTEREIYTGAPLCIIGKTVQKKLFQANPPIGNLIRIDKFPCQVIGIQKSKKVGGGMFDADDQILIPLKTLQRHISGQQNLTQIRVTVKSARYTAEIKAELTQLLRESHKLKQGEQDDFYINDPHELINSFSKTSQSLNLFLATIGSISLLVGGIGIMNIMLASVHERTREIGIRLAIGALRNEVLLQFLIEAIFLALFGGLIGIILAIFLSMGIGHVMAIPYQFDPKINLIAFNFSALIGVVFGYLPARKAAQLDPIQALRHE